MGTPATIILLAVPLTLLEARAGSGPVSAFVSPRPVLVPRPELAAVTACQPRGRRTMRLYDGGMVPDDKAENIDEDASHTGSGDDDDDVDDDEAGTVGVDDILAKNPEVQRLLQNSDAIGGDEIVIAIEDSGIDIGTPISGLSLDAVEAITRLALDHDIAASTVRGEKCEKRVENCANISTGEKSTAELNIDNSIVAKRDSEKRKGRFSLEKLDKSIPSYSSIVKFVTTTVLIWLSEPLLSLIDTTVVGKWGGSTTASVSPTLLGKASALVGLGKKLQIPSASVLNLASLGPATLLIDNCLYVNYFLSIATTNKIAKNLAEKDSEGLVRTTSNVLGVAIVLGLGMTMFIWGLGPRILSGIIGESVNVSAGGAVAGASAIKETIVFQAVLYTRIRSFIAPLTLIGLVCQSICLASLDLKSPVLAVIFTSFVNIVGDWLLVVKFAMGIKGAAIATALANVVSCSILLNEVSKKIRRWRAAAAEEIETRDWKEGRVAIGGSNLSTQTTEGGEIFVDASTAVARNNSNNTDTEAAVSDFIGVLGSKAKRKLSIANPKQKEDGKPKGNNSLPTTNKRSKSPINPSSFAAVLAAAYATPTSRTGSASRLVGFLTNNPIVRAAKKIIRSRSENEIGFKTLPPLISLPQRAEFVSICKLAGPIFIVMLLKVACYTAMTLRSADFGVEKMAAHNVLLRVFFFFAVFGDAFNQAAQTFLPGVLYGEGELPKLGQGLACRSRRVKAVLARMLLCAALVSVVNTAASSQILQRFGGFFTSDGAIADLMASNSLWMTLSILLHPAVMLFEGSIMARQDLLFLARSYFATIIALFSLLQFRVSDFGGVWQAFFLFQMVRLGQFSARVWTKTIKGNGK